jgi:methionine synthase II (cobalamin-independent)
VGARVGDVAHAIPDGETGERSGWIRWLRARLARADRSLFIPAAPDGSGDQLALKPGVSPDTLRLGPLGYGEAAQISYRTFRQARAEGHVAPGTRLQVSIPTPAAMATGIRAPFRLLVDAFERAAIDEVRALCDAIPAADLAIQWDVCVETVAEEGEDRPESVRDSARGLLNRWSLDDAMTSCARICDAVAPQAQVGVHLCYGDPDGAPIVVPRDARALKEIANRIAAGARRRLDWVHLPVPIERDDASFFAPLQQLNLAPETAIFLGLIHHRDGLAGARRRIAAAEKILPRFGVAAPCGMGRIPREHVPALLDLHRAVALGG